ncbi:IS21 family transposase [Paenibacillus sp. SYP-B3998]|uniref:IS21 family transposase n=2 Tax=Paenibacillus sp. SYP-B3998 TaxID=2678564 RepID=A0A6G3ZTG2_9BACL|nr:IS21 family transposase [Paenibacillus sp. SYP-B3998]
MIQMNIMQQIIMKHTQEGMSCRAIARSVGMNRETVGKHIKKYEERRRQLLAEGSSSVEIEALIESLTAAPKYQVGNRPKRKLTESMEQKIQEHLDENEEKRNKGQRKQQKKPVDIFEAMEAEGMDISYSTVLRVVRSLEQQPKEAFIKASYELGDVCEFDWGEVKLTIGGTLRTFQMAAFTTAYGNYRYACLFTKQKTECFQEAHARFFEHVGGVHQTLVYDNMKVAVKSFIGAEKEPTEALLQLSIYYGFQFRFCNVRSGNEKGHVERTVEVARRKAFSVRDTFDTLEEANAYLLAVCGKLNGKPQDSREGKSAEACLEEERSCLLPKMPLFDASRSFFARVDKYATVIVDQNHYSVPDHFVGQLAIKVYSGRIQCFHDGRQVAEHARLVGCHEWRLELSHYLETLKKKPGALAGSTALQQAQTKWKNIYETYYTRREKDFVELLQMMADGVTLVEVEHSVAELCRIHPSHVTTDKIKALCARAREVLPPQALSSQESQDIEAHAQQHLRLYDELFQTQPVPPKEAVA